MLQNELPPAPGQIRVTPEELNQAVAAIEARKQKEAGTIPIDEAVSSLHLDATPDEIWAEVQAQRDAEAAQRARAVQAAGARHPFQAQYAAPPAQTVQPSRGGRRRWVRWLPLVAIFWALNVNGVFHLGHFGHSSHSTPPAMTAILAKVSDGQEFYCDTATLVQISEGKPLTQVRVDPSERFDNSWTLIKNAGHVYLRAYTLPLDSVQAAQGKPLNLFNDDNSGDLEGERTAQTTVRVDDVPLQISGGDHDNYSEVTISNFQPDSLTRTSPWH